MGHSLASFRDLKGIGPATEARLHETGIYTWEALAVAATALAAVREGDTPRDVASAVAARRAEAEDGDSALCLPGGERLESFLLRIALTADGVPQRSEVTHVRTMTERAWAGWSPGEFASFVQEHSGIQLAASSPEEASHDELIPAEPTPGGEASSRSRRQPDTAARKPPSTDHLVVLDAGKAIGGASRDINLVITNTRAAKGDFGYQATLAARRLGTGNGESWTTVASHTGTGSAAGEVALEFPGVQLPSGIHRLQLRLAVNLPAPTSKTPQLALA
ncbi:MAG TPA: hypothetical protein VKG85_04100 [Actinomycetes bacterium]|nr:hypothetical protein [Actinomycetes bacterium]